MKRLTSSIAVVFVLAIALTAVNAYAKITQEGQYPFPSSGHSFATDQPSLITTPWKAAKEDGQRPIYAQWFDREYGLSPSWTEEQAPAPGTRVGNITQESGYPFVSGHSFAMEERGGMTMERQYGVNPSWGGEMMSVSPGTRLGNIHEQWGYPFVSGGHPFAMEQSGTIKEYGMSPEWMEPGSNGSLVTTPYKAERQEGRLPFYARLYDREYALSPCWTEEGGVAPGTRLGNITEQWGYPFVSCGHAFAPEE